MPKNMKKILYISLILFTVVCTGYFSDDNLFSEISNSSQKTISATQPEFSIPIHRSCYSMQFDGRTKNAVYVYERLTEECLKGESTRHNCQFREDDQLPEIFRSNLTDYRGSGFDKGHLAPAANHKASSAEMKDTFYLSNISPQHPQFNRGYWAKLEKHVRDLTKSCDVLHVFTGPLFLPETHADGTRWIKYRVIGKNDVSVPTHFFKVIYLCKSQNEICSKAYILPNTQIDSKISLDTFETTIQRVEKAAGVLFPHFDH